MAVYLSYVLRLFQSGDSLVEWPDYLRQVSRLSQLGGQNVSVKKPDNLCQLPDNFTQVARLSQLCIWTISVRLQDYLSHMARISHSSGQTLLVM